MAGFLKLGPHPLPPEPVPSSIPPPPPSAKNPVGGVMSGFCGGLLMTGPDNQRVCKCQYVIFFKPFVYGQDFKGRYFYGNCRWSILLYIYVINM